MTEDDGSLRSQASGGVVESRATSQLLRGMARRASAYRRSWRGSNASLSTARREYKELLRMVANAAGITRMTVKPQQITELILRRRADVLKLREERDALRADMTIRHDALNGVLGRPRDTSPSDYYEAVEAVAELKREISRIRAQPAVSESVPATPKACVCNGGWTVDENYQPEDYERNDPLRPEKGLVPCGFCNHGGWDAPWPPVATPSRDSATSEASTEFFEEDEPVEEIKAAFDSGIKFVTAPSTSASPVRVDSASTPPAAGEADTTPREPRSWTHGDDEPGADVTAVRAENSQVFTRVLVRRWYDGAFPLDEPHWQAGRGEALRWNVLTSRFKRQRLVEVLPNTEQEATDDDAR